MSQFDWGIIDPNSKSGPQLALDLNDFRDALNTLHRGATHPPYAQPGMLWVKEVSSERWELTVFDGTVDHVLRAFNPTTSSLIPLELSDIEGLADALSKAVQKDAPTTTGAALIPGGSQAQRPSTPVPGMLRFNADLSEFERYQGGKWLALNLMDKALNEAPIVTLASAATVNIGAAAANTISVTDAITINAFDTIAAGATRRLVFQESLKITHNPTSLILPGGLDILTSAGDAVEFVSLGSGNWRCIAHLTAQTKLSLEVRDVKPLGTNGGTQTAGAWRTRDLNSVVRNNIPGASLSGNLISLPAGTYRINASTSTYACADVKLRVAASVSDATLLLGKNFNILGTASLSDVSPVISGLITLSATTTVALQMWSSASQASAGQGRAVSIGTEEVYTVLEIEKV